MHNKMHKNTYFNFDMHKNQKNVFVLKKIMPYIKKRSIIIAECINTKVYLYTQKVHQITFVCFQ